MNTESYFVKVSGCPVGTETLSGTVTASEQVDMDHYRVTFSTGEVRTMRYNQTLSVVKA